MTLFELFWTYLLYFLSQFITANYVLVVSIKKCIYQIGIYQQYPHF